jgi:glycosyltransferase involved in cell wall biosynthesis
MAELSLVVPVYNEGASIGRLLDEIEAKIHVPHEILLVYDREDDDTLPPARARARPEMRLVKNGSRGALEAIKTGMREARGRAVVVVMADLAEDLAVVDEMYRRIEEGCDLVCGSRYMKGGAQLGGPRLKAWLSRAAGLSLHHLTGIPTHDITNSFKMYSRRVIESFPVESDGGFEIGMELTLKSYLAGMRVAEVPSVWRDRTSGRSNFRLLKWLPKYLKWYFVLVRGALLRRGLAR